MEENRNEAITNDIIRKDNTMEQNIIEDNLVNKESTTPNPKLLTPIEMVQKLMAELGVSITDLPDYQNVAKDRDYYNEQYEKKLTEYWRLVALVKDKFWQKFLDEMDASDAYDWLEENISPEWIDELDLHRKLYKVIKVTTDFTVVIPNDKEPYEWSDYVSADMSELDFDYKEEDSELTEDDVNHLYRPINEIDDLN